MPPLQKDPASSGGNSEAHGCRKGPKCVRLGLDLGSRAGGYTCCPPLTGCVVLHFSSIPSLFFATATQADSRTLTPHVTNPRTLPHTLRRCPVQAVSDSAAAARSAGAATHISRVPVDAILGVSGYLGFSCFVFIQCGLRLILDRCPMGP